MYFIQKSPVNLSLNSNKTHLETVGSVLDVNLCSPWGLVSRKGAWWAPFPNPPLLLVIFSYCKWWWQDASGKQSIYRCPLYQSAPRTFTNHRICKCTLEHPVIWQNWTKFWQDSSRQDGFVRLCFIIGSAYLRKVYGCWLFILICLLESFSAVIIINPRSFLIQDTVVLSRNSPGGQDQIYFWCEANTCQYCFIGHRVFLHLPLEITVSRPICYMATLTN